MNGSVIYSDTVKIWIPETLGNLLGRDAELFEVYGGKEHRVVMNKFLNILILGYYDTYRNELARQESGLRSLLSPYIRKKKDLEQVIGKIIGEERKSTGRGDTDSRLLRLRPTGDAVNIHADISDNSAGINESVSGFYRNMFLSYSRLPAWERERIIYNDVTEVIENVLEKQTELRFSTRDNPRHVHRVLPYRLAYGSDEQFNCLLCQEMDEKGKRIRAASYRLRRIVSPKPVKAEQDLDPLVKKHLELMMKYDPQYTINEDSETCIRLTEKGRNDFRMIYLGRPAREENMDQTDEDGTVKYYFHCSSEQLFNYFKRFNPGEATVVYPTGLKEKLIRYHKNHVEALMASSDKTIKS